MVNLISYLLPPRQAIAAIGTYLIMGLIGLPVFSGGTAGVGKLFGPTGWFYFGFLFSVIAVSLLLRKKHTLFRFGLASIFVGIPIQHIAAILFMCFYNNFNPVAAALTVSVPFFGWRCDQVHRFCFDCKGVRALHGAAVRSFRNFFRYVKQSQFDFPQ